MKNMTYFDKTDIHEGFNTNLDLESALILWIFTDFWRDSKCRPLWKPIEKRPALWRIFVKNVVDIVEKSQNIANILEQKCYFDNAKTADLNWSTRHAELETPWRFTRSEQSCTEREKGGWAVVQLGPEPQNLRQPWIRLVWFFQYFHH